MNIIFLNGKFVPENEAMISIFDRGFIFGDGIYDVVPVVNSHLVDKEDFWLRLNQSVEKTRLSLPMNKDEYFQTLNRLIKENNLVEGTIYTQITRGVAPRTYFFPENVKPTYIAFCVQSPILNHPLAQEGIDVKSVEDLRWKRRDIKAISLLPQCLNKQLVRENGYFEGFMVEDGFVSEGITSTAYIVKNGKIITTPLSNQILPGIRRKNVIKLAEKLDIEVEHRHFSIEEAKQADEAFVSSASLLVMPVVTIDDCKINGKKIGPITTKIRDAYIAMIKKEANLS